MPQHPKTMTPDGPAEPVARFNKKPAKEEPPSLERIHGTIIKIRDISLAVAGLTYVLGYIVWSKYAYDNNLGLMPLVESQYLAAGVIPLLIIWAIWGTVRSFVRFLEDTVRGLSEKSTAIQKRVSRSVGVTLIFAVCTLLVFAAQSARHMLKGPALTGCLAIAFMTVCLYTVMISIASGDISRDWKFTAIEVLITATVPVAVGLLACYIYVESSFPYWSQELGGALPRVGQIDIVRNDLSEEAKESLLPPSATSRKGQVARTVPVFVYFRGSDRWLIKTFPKPSSETFDIAPASVKSVTWENRQTAFAALTPMRQQPPTNKSPKHT